MIRAVTLWGGPRDGQTRELPPGTIFAPNLLPLGSEGVYLFHHFADDHTIVYHFVDFEAKREEDELFSQWEAQFE